MKTELKEKMQVVMLPTKDVKYSNNECNRLIKHNKLGLIIFAKGFDIEIGKSYTQQHLYICSNKEIKANDWFINKITDKVKQRTPAYISIVGDKKIEASTDKSLGLPEPSIDFIRKYIELQGNIEEVMVEMEFIITNEDWTKTPIQLDGYYQPKVKPDNTISISKVENIVRYDDMIKFVTWYSGIAKDKVISAYNRYLNEKTN